MGVSLVPQMLRNRQIPSLQLYQTRSDERDCLLGSGHWHLCCLVSYGSVQWLCYWS
jgi:hypothetical protein